jgi:beta-glucanase (GH16 family)
MLGSNIEQVGWPVCGEIDIMEMVGHQPATVHGTGHFDRDGHQFTGTSWSLSPTEKFGDKFHVFTILWQEGLIEWFVDYHKFFSLKAKDVGFNYPFDEPFFFIANIAVGGQWPGDPDETTAFSQTMEVDYIRVFQTANMD